MDGETDLIIIDGNQVDLEVCSHEDELMHRVWRLSKPPTDMKFNEPTITARRIYRQNRVIRDPAACVHPPADDTHCPKSDKKRVKDPCGCCDACGTNEKARKKSVVSEINKRMVNYSQSQRKEEVSEIKFYDLPSESVAELNMSSMNPL